MSLSSNPNSYAGDRKDGGQSGDASLNTLLNANNLDSYVLPSALSVTVARSHKKSYSVADTYAVGTGATSSSTVSFVLTPGADYVYGPDSYFTFDLTHTVNEADTDSWFGQYGSVLNIFKSIRLTHASGTEIEYINNLNLLNYFKLQYDRDETYRATDGSGFGATYTNGSSRRINREGGANDVDVKGTPDGLNLRGSFPSATVTLSTGAAASTDTVKFTGNAPNSYFTVLKEVGTAANKSRFCVPLSMLSEFFNSDKLLPPYVLAGMRIELELENPSISTQSFNNTTGNDSKLQAATTHTLSDLNMQLDSHTLTDSVAKALSRMSANEGLDLHFPSYFHDRHALASASSTINVTKALSRVEDICLIPRLKANFDGKFADVSPKDSFAAVPYATTTKWQISIGSMFFPSHPVRSAHDSYRLALQGRRHMCRVPFLEYSTEGLGIMRGALERSQILNGSGIAVSATRGANINVELEDNTVTAVDLFVRHTMLVSVFLDNVVVRT